MSEGRREEGQKYVVGEGERAGTRERQEGMK